MLSNGHAGFGRAARGNGPAETPDTAPLVDPYLGPPPAISATAVDPVAFMLGVHAPLGGG